MLTSRSFTCFMEDATFLKDWVLENAANLLPSELLKEIEGEIVEEEERNHAGPAKKRRRTTQRVRDFWNQPWGKMLRDPSIWIEGTKAYKDFRRTFRMPGPLFLDFFIPEIKSVNLFDVQRESAIPVEIKCMIALNVLGRGSCCHAMVVASGVGESTCLQLFHAFIRGMVKYFFKDTVKPPTGERLKVVMDTYARLGYPGAVGSIDCTHIFWNKCPVAMSNLCRGKDKFPSLSFEVVVDHKGFIHSCTDGFVGTCSDKLIVVNDPYAKLIARGLYKDVEFSLYNENGSFTTYAGCYLISDCGYTRQWMFQMPVHNACDARSVYWSEFLESVRKDVERTFGILKARFLFLWHGVQYHDPSTITAAMQCCCILHNWILVHDTYASVDWVGMDPDAEPVVGDDVADPELNNDIEPGIEPEDPIPAALSIHTGLSIVPRTRDARVVHYHQHDHGALNDALMTHFQYCYGRRCMVWPRGFSAQQRLTFPIALGTRLPVNVLYTAPSWYNGLDEQQQYTVPIGKGLFSCIRLGPEVRVVQFLGREMPRVEYEARCQERKGGYALHINEHSVYDCWEERHRCYASMANSPLQLRTARADLRSVPVANCRLLRGWSGGKVIFSLETSVAVPAHTELFWSYQRDYIVHYQLPAV